MNMQIEQEVAEALLDVGASLPLKDIKLPFRKQPLKLRLNMKRPCLGNQMRIAREYLKMGVTYEQMRRFSKEEEMDFLVRNGKHLTKMVALTICRGAISGTLFSGLLSWFLRWFVEDVYLQGANIRFVSLLGTKSFGNIIKSVETTNPMTPQIQSQKRKGS